MPMQYLYKLSLTVLRSMVLREREGGGDVGVVRKKKEEYICIGIHESIWCVCVSGGGGGGGGGALEGSRF